MLSKIQIPDMLSKIQIPDMLSKIQIQDTVKHIQRWSPYMARKVETNNRKRHI
jgi:hypothetical protein